MRTDGIAGVVFSFVFCLFCVSADTAGKVQAASPDEAKTARTTPAISAGDAYFDPDLESILAVNDRSLYEFLSRLTPAERQALARMIRKRVDDEAGVVVARFFDDLSPAKLKNVAERINDPATPKPSPRAPAIVVDSREISFQVKSAGEPHRQGIETQVREGRNAMAIYQDLVEKFSFEHCYNSVKRFVRGLKKKVSETDKSFLWPIMNPWRL